MRWTTTGALLLVASGLTFVAGRSSVGKTPTVNEQTRKNLDSAMHGEAFAHAKYLLYADQARKNKHADIADLFERAAKTERMEHFAEEAEIAGLVGSDAENLRDAIKGENYETTTMYPDFEKQAEKVGDKAAAERFEEIRKDELNHRNDFQTALDRLERRSATP